MTLQPGERLTPKLVVSHAAHDYAGSTERRGDAGKVRRCAAQMRSGGQQIPQNFADSDQYHEALQYTQ